MNYLNKNKTNRELKDLIKRINQKEGWCKIFSNNHLIHELVKFQIMHKLKKEGYEVWSEAEFNKPYSGRCDIFAIQGGSCLIIEVLDSETEEECKNKCKKYPKELCSLIFVKTDNFNVETFKL